VPLLQSSEYIECVKLTSSKPNVVDDDLINAVFAVSHVYRLKLGILEKFSTPELDQPSQSGIELSDRQIEIVKWIREGKSNGDIATIMNLPLRTVKHHVSVIIRKLGVATRAQVASLALPPS